MYHDPTTTLNIDVCTLGWEGFPTCGASSAVGVLRGSALAGAAARLDDGLGTAEGGPLPSSASAPTQPCSHQQHKTRKTRRNHPHQSLFDPPLTCCPPAPWAGEARRLTGLSLGVSSPPAPVAPSSAELLDTRLGAAPAYTQHTRDTAQATPHTLDRASTRPSPPTE